MYACICMCVCTRLCHNESRLLSRPRVENDALLVKAAGKPWIAALEQLFHCIFVPCHQHMHPIKPFRKHGPQNETNAQADPFIDLWLSATTPAPQLHSQPTSCITPFPYSHTYTKPCTRCMIGKTCQYDKEIALKFRLRHLTHQRIDSFASIAACIYLKG